MELPPAKDRGRELEVQHFEDTPDTPGWLRDWVYSQFPITYDAEGTDLTRQWEGFVFHHPPHQEAQLWCEKAAGHAQKGIISVLLLPAVFNSIYWRQVVYRHAAEIRVLACPLKKPGAKKQIVSQMALVIFAQREEADKGNMPPIFVTEPETWKQNYYKRQRNMARFGAQ